MEDTAAKVKPTAPREMQPADRRRIFRALDEVYDEINARYVDAHTDKTVAESLSMPRKWIEDVREESFGPSGHNTDMERLETAILRAISETRAVMETLLAGAAHAESRMKEIDALKLELATIRASVDPRRR